jgi:hypothetical protein
MMLQGRFREFSESHLLALERIHHLMTSEAIQQVKLFSDMRHTFIWKRISLFREGKFYRQTRFGCFGLWVALAFKKI